ncbi:hypothetical protein [Nocardioides plantarum]|uniref:DUF4352 domain-containing protein n=1 Tax=Nocardioides plantarum TaxID=29299 RepID=A0ABV5KC90_9ACTN|nr:hypothetical protein [Nocardioides plantarum]
MHLRSCRPSLTLGSLAVLAAVSLSACGDDSDGSDAGAEESSEPTSAAAEPETTQAPETSEPTEEPSEEPSEEPAAPGSGTNPAWALPPVIKGDLVTTINAGDVKVDVYQVGTAKAEDTGNFTDPDTNKPLIEVGDTLVFLNYVITNNGDPIDLGSSLVNVTARYDDWPYMQGMDGLTGDDLYEAQGIHDSDLAPDGFNEAGIYTLGTGESFSYGDNFEYQKSSPIDFKVEYVPVDDEGELLFDERVDKEGSGKIA